MKEEMEGPPASMNAFEFISLNKGLNLDNLFESDKVRNIFRCSSVSDESVCNQLYIYHKLLSTFLYKWFRSSAIAAVGSILLIYDRSTREKQDLHLSVLPKKSSIG